MKRLTMLLLVCAVCFLSSDSTALCRATSDNAHEKLVRDFVAAFNARELDSMLSMVNEKVQWLNLNGSNVSVEAEGKSALRETMERYFQSCPTCKSSLEWIQTAGGRVTAMERATWSTKTGARAQRSLSVYEFSDGKILRVYYFPAELVAAP